MQLSVAQNTLMRELYNKTIEESTPQYYVWTKNTDYRTVYALFNAGFITSSCLRNGKPTNMQLSREGYDYGWRNFGTTDDKQCKEEHQKENGIFIQGDKEYKKNIRRKLYL